MLLNSVHDVVLVTMLERSLWQYEIYEGWNAETIDSHQLYTDVFSQARLARNTKYIGLHTEAAYLIMS